MLALMIAAPSMAGMAQSFIGNNELSQNGQEVNVNEIDTMLRDDGGFGLVNIKERVELLNGTLQIRSEIDKGTKIYVYIPNEK